MVRGKVTVFGGTGFLGRHVVQHLLDCEFSIRVTSRHPERTAALFPDVRLGIESIHADINDDRSVAAAVAAVEGVVNAVSLYVESGQETFHSVHVTGAARVARLAREARVRQLIHVSGIGSDAGSSSPYIRSRGEGEMVVREAFPAVALIRPSVMFGRGDAFVTPVARMLRRLPIFPLFGRGQTQLQPAHVDDVAEAIARAMQTAQPRTLSSADRASTPTECCSKCLHGIWAESQFWFPSRLVSGARLRTSRRCCLSRPSRAIKSNSCK